MVALSDGFFTVVSPLGRLFYRCRLNPPGFDSLRFRAAALTRISYPTIHRSQRPATSKVFRVKPMKIWSAWVCKSRMYLTAYRKPRLIRFIELIRTGIS